MPELTLSAVRKRFTPRGAEVLKGVDLTVAAGEMLVLLGPSGCGKTTLLRCIAGLESPSAGSIRHGDSTLFDAGRRIDVPAEKRSAGMVFQQYALWPHMDVRKIIGYPLRMRRVARRDREEKIKAVARLVDCADLLDRYPSSLSGGQQQRIALARALVASPDFVLFDEPLSNLDAKLRETLRVEIRELHRRNGFTGVYVTHDQSEAFAIADRVAVMREGEIVQLDSPETVWRRPGSEWVADFVGASNRLSIQDAWNWTSNTAGRQWLDGQADAGAEVIRARPTDIEIATSTSKTDGSDEFGVLELAGPILRTVVFGGTEIDYSVEWPDGSRWRAKTRTVAEDMKLGEALSENSGATLRVNTASLLAYDSDGHLIPASTESTSRTTYDRGADDKHDSHARAH
jgi:iron(III) transport system ATP-binding protein